MLLCSTMSVVAQRLAKKLVKKGEVMKQSNLTLSLVAVCCLATFTNAAETKPKPKRTLNGDMTLVYNKLPEKANNLTEALTKGEFYGRLRVNAFAWDWDSPDVAKGTQGNRDNQVFGIGGSLIYKTAPLYGISATTGLYVATSPFNSLIQTINENDADIKYVKSGKDTFSRYDVKYNNSWTMAVLAEAYLQYDVAKTSIKVGRQLVDTPLTASNDTKMIPNAFEGLTVVSKDIADTTLTGAYLTRQKLRDHTSFHNLLTFKDAAGESWGNNDDAPMHQGLTYARLHPLGLDDQALSLLWASNKSIKNLKLDFTYGTVPHLLSYGIAEANYKLPISDKYALNFGARHFQQFDDGAGAIGGASLNGGLATWASGSTQKGYTNPKSLDGSVSMAKVALTDGIFKAQLGYSHTADKADIVAPWRAFPTGGYTRAMAQTNWYANTDATMLELTYDLGKANIVNGLKVVGRYVIQDFDDAKQAAGVQADSKVIHVDVIKQITPCMDARFRMGLVDAEKRTLGGNAGKDVDSYNEFRAEINYLF